jgi:hypothetical protein
MWMQAGSAERAEEDFIIISRRQETGDRRQEVSKVATPRRKAKGSNKRSRHSFAG